MSISATTQSTIDECVARSHAGSIVFGEIVMKLIGVGIESYHADYRRRENTYYLPSGDTQVNEMHTPAMAIGDAFDAHAVEQAVRGAQNGAVKYPEFMRRTMAAGCVGYFVWIAGRQVQYHGRRGEVHVERFPD